MFGFYIVPKWELSERGLFPDIYCCTVGYLFYIGSSYWRLRNHHYQQVGTCYLLVVMICNSDWIKPFLSLFEAYLTDVSEERAGCVRISLDYNPRLLTCDTKDLHRFASCHSRCTSMSRVCVWMSNEERMSCSHGLTVCWQFNACRYFFGPWWRWCVFVWEWVSECWSPEGAILNVALPPAGVLRNYIVAYSIQEPPLRGCERVDVVTSLAAFCRPNLSWPSGTNWLDPVCARIHQGW
jgi:hypothetical protein